MSTRLTIVIVAICAAFAFSSYIQRPAEPPAPLPCPPRLQEEILSGSNITVHISYNNLTNGRSKYEWNHNGQTEYLLMGSSDDRTVQCSVSQTFYEMASENTHVEIPRNKCWEIKP